MEISLCWVNHWRHIQVSYGQAVHFHWWCHSPQKSSHNMYTALFVGFVTRAKADTNRGSRRMCMFHHAGKKTRLGCSVAFAIEKHQLWSHEWRLERRYSGKSEKTCESAFTVPTPFCHCCLLLYTRCHVTEILKVNLRWQGWLLTFESRLSLLASVDGYHNCTRRLCAFCRHFAPGERIPFEVTSSVRIPYTTHVQPQCLICTLAY